MDYDIEETPVVEETPSVEATPADPLTDLVARVKNHEQAIEHLSNLRDLFTALVEAERGTISSIDALRQEIAALRHDLLR